MDKARRIDITIRGRDSRVVIDGHDISGLVHAAHIDAEANGPNCQRITLELTGWQAEPTITGYLIDEETYQAFLSWQVREGLEDKPHPITNGSYHAE